MPQLFISFFISLLFYSCVENTSRHLVQNSTPGIAYSGTRINGAGLVASRHPIDTSEFSALKSVSVNSVCLLPFAYVKEGEPRIYFNNNFQWWGERPEGIACCIEMAHAKGLSVMVKPQLWVSDGKYTGELLFNSEQEWTAFESSYSTYIFQLLRVADSLHAEFFCLGTELDAFVKERNSYWSALIDSARKVYHGKLTYAGNWDCFELFPYWEKMDFIGINAYFPLSDSITPQVNELIACWQPPYNKMKLQSEKSGRPVLFTEYGYRSIDYATRRPWESYTDGTMNAVAQRNGYEALYLKFWKEEWFAGGFFWKWFDEHTPTDVPAEMDFSPQGKPAMDVIQQWYGSR